MHYLTVVALGLLSTSMEYGPKQNLISGSDPRSEGEIQQFESPSLPVCSDLSVSAVNIDKI